MEENKEQQMDADKVPVYAEPDAAIPGIKSKPESEPEKVGIEDPEMEAKVLEALRRLKRGSTYSFTVYAKGPIQEKVRSGRKPGI
jgi:hypothetical protein